MSPNPPSILIVEDESIVALDLKLALQDLGYPVSGVAASGERAVQLVDEQPPGLVLMDVRLQGEMDGIETARRIRVGHDVPVIFLTSHSDSETVQRAALTAPYGYLTKPYQVKELRAGIEVALAKSRMERQLREADRWFAHTLQCVADGVVVTDTDGRIRFLNPAAERLTGWTLEQAAGLPVDEVVRFQPATGPGGQPLAVRDAAQVVRSVVRHGRPRAVAHALPLLSRDGHVNPVDETAGPVDDAEGQRLGAVLVLRDATPRLAQEAQLRASEERFRNAFDFAPLGMALVSLGGEFIQANDALCRLLGASRSDLAAHGHQGLTLPGDRDHEAERLTELLGGDVGAVVQYEKRYLRLDGREPLSALVSVSLLHEGELPTCLLFQVHDLSEQKRAAAQLAELAAERLKREASELANAAKSEFLSRVSHEMRTPLNAVIGFAQLLQLQTGLEPVTVGSYAQHIQAAGEHLLHLVEDLLDLHSAARGKLKMTLVPTPLPPTLDEVVQLLSPLAQAHGIALRIARPPDAGLRLQADATRLRQVLLNLVSNAIKYNRQGGEVGIEAWPAEAGLVRLVVRDSGIGMTAEQLSRLFQPFDRLGREHGSVPGTGLGLVIARSLVEEMGGALQVDSVPREGTVVTMRLPVA